MPRWAAEGWAATSATSGTAYGYQWWSATAGDHHVDFAWGHGEQLIVLVDELDVVIVTTAYPFYLEHNGQSRKHEKATIDLVGRFVDFLS